MLRPEIGSRPTLIVPARCPLAGISPGRGSPLKAPCPGRRSTVRARPLKSRTPPLRGGGHHRADVFTSHSKADRLLVEQLAAYLESEGAGLFGGTEAS